nr:DegV family protein [Clostridium baratii]
MVPFKVLAKLKVEKKAIKTLYNYFEEKFDYSKDDTIFISHGDCIEEAQKLASIIKEKFDVNIIINYIGPAIGSHSGPNTLAIFFKSLDRNL